MNGYINLFGRTSVKVASYLCTYATAIKSVKSNADQRISVGRLGTKSALMNALRLSNKKRESEIGNRTVIGENHQDGLVAIVDRVSNSH